MVFYMPLPEKLRDQVEERMDRFCRERVPEHARCQRQMSYKIRGHLVTLIEERIAFAEPGNWIDIPGARNEFASEDFFRRPLWSDRNVKWQEFPNW